ncbi:predicted protein [Micromonas commoda]|uniref:Uncharacterized protein n=1 Tax=Micromonas commoda (strain RCC299 / NOUM17 / CCMP2709) TaxID=296587 RepID=C1DYT1_MICCC|nr:predicted protein [Micromonas commoda]ACO60997.1 predicted protein [Micromonas commoda]|eukprot:XP_002499739.1 predicted protein [Micromonas commoda]
MDARDTLANIFTSARQYSQHVVTTASARWISSHPPPDRTHLASTSPAPANAPRPPSARAPNSGRTPATSPDASPAPESPRRNSRRPIVTAPRRARAGRTQRLEAATRPWHLWPRRPPPPPPPPSSPRSRPRQLCRRLSSSV